MGQTPSNPKHFFQSSDSPWTWRLAIGDYCLALLICDSANGDRRLAILASGLLKRRKPGAPHSPGAGRRFSLSRGRGPGPTRAISSRRSFAETDPSAVGFAKVEGSATPDLSAIVSLRAGLWRKSHGDGPPRRSQTGLQPEHCLCCTLRCALNVKYPPCLPTLLHCSTLLGGRPSGA